jgi:hypothetical protein
MARDNVGQERSAALVDRSSISSFSGLIAPAWVHLERHDDGKGFGIFAGSFSPTNPAPLARASK